MNDDLLQSREEKVLVFALGTLHGMVQDGLIESGCFGLSKVGLEQFAALKAEGFNPTEREMREALQTIQEECAIHAAEVAERN